MDRASVPQRPQLRHNQVVLQRFWMIEVMPVSFLGRKMRKIAVVEIKREKDAVELRGKLARKGRFAGAGTATDCDHGWPDHFDGRELCAHAGAAPRLETCGTIDSSRAEN